MNRLSVLFVSLLLLVPAWAEEESSQASQDTPKQLSGMSVLGNNEAPKALVIVPWRGSEIGTGMDLARSLNGLPRPVDREVFARQVHYLDLRSRARDVNRLEVDDVAFR